jgi:hypothetical protein
MCEELDLKYKKEKRDTYLKRDSQEQRAKIKKKKKKKKSKNADDTDDDDSEDTSCLYRGASREMWIQCTDCNLRSHEECTDGSSNCLLKLPVSWVWNTLFGTETYIAVGRLVSY